MSAISMPLIITIEKDGGPRRRSAVAEARINEMSPRFVESVSASSPIVRQIYDPAAARSLRKTPMTAGEVACYCGHRLAWEEGLRNGAPWFLVLEDDFEIVDPVALRLLDSYLTRLEDWDLINLSSFNPKGIHVGKDLGGFELRSMCFIPTGAVGYFISRRGAKKMLSRQSIFRPVDEDFANPWELGLNVLTTAPNLVREREGTISTLDENRRKRTRDPASTLRGCALKLRWQLLSYGYWHKKRTLNRALKSGRLSA